MFYIVKKVIFKSNNGYKIIKAKNEATNKEIIIKGNIPFALKKNDRIKVEGEYGVDKYGEYVYVNKIDFMYETTMDGLKDLLMRTKGIGKVKATQLIDKYQENILDVLEKEPERIVEELGIKREIVDRMITDIIEPNLFNEFIVDCRMLGLGMKDSIKLFNNRGGLSIYEILNNPYLLMDMIGMDFISADRIAMKNEIDVKSKVRITAGIKDYLIKNTGDLYVYYNDIIKELDKYIEEKTEIKAGIEEEEIEETISDMIEEKVIVVDVDENNEDIVYLKGMHFMETFIADEIKNRIGENDEEFDEETIEMILGMLDIKLKEKQKKAVYAAINNDLTIISGGPGTGKTYTVGVIIQLLQFILPDKTIGLAAPTGKASSKMTETTGMQAMTIHRMLGLGFEEEQELKDIDYDYLILDEVSMIDIQLMYYLMKCVSDETKIIFIGDKDQLPSVGPGNILRDLIVSGKIDVIVLDEIVRQDEDSLIIENAYKILNKNKDLCFSTGKDGDFYFLEINNENKEETIASYLVASINNMINNRGYSLNDIQVLSPIKDGVLGVKNLNKIIQEVFNNTNSPSFRANGYDIKKNDKVIHVENNKELDTFNGETGIVKDIIIEDELNVIVEYQDKEVIYTKDDIAQLELAYVITIHKAQGSEYPVVLMPIDNSLSILLNKNSIYTAITRAVDSIVLIGDKDVLLDNMVKEIDKRNSLLWNRI